ncbi:MAG: hypothetical protein ACOC4C_04955, partial [Fibrobacterota bacterium]
YDRRVASDMFAKSMAEKIHWSTRETPGKTGIGTIGKNPEENNRSGFSALPGGYRDLQGDFLGNNFCGIWWSSYEIDEVRGHAQELHYNYGGMHWRPDSKRRAFSVRLLRDVSYTE